MTDSLLRVYLDPDEIGKDGYPHVWHKPGWERLIEEGAKTVGEEQAAKAIEFMRTIGGLPEVPKYQPIKDLIREQAGYRCVRCGHPYPPGITKECPKGEWTPCDDQCTHGEPIADWSQREGVVVAQWRILTTHHLNGIKHDCRWWNLAALCQRCHLKIQGRVNMDRVWPFEHSDWFKPYAAGWYAWSYLGEDLTREETMERLQELLELERSV